MHLSLLQENRRLGHPQRLQFLEILPQDQDNQNWNLAHVLSSHHPSVTVVCFLHGGEPTHPNLFHSREYHWATTHTHMTWSFQYQQLAILRRLCFKRDKTTLAPLLLEQSKTLHSLKHYKTCLQSTAACVSKQCYTLWGRPGARHSWVSSAYLQS